ncbi:hypothetical protein [Actinophytocola glycyrrhizae]|uniref:Excreted virulence factor EspC (Type VII ESX diderm) n=1 Tax=Actinophytocola glycyrrhizae TaxID=2044873 RepID=A0ABV9SCS0_9PSEU
MNGFAAMDPGPVEEAAQRLRQHGEQLASGWGAAKSAISGAEAGIGTGRLADAFRQTYQPASQTVTTNADAFPPKFADLAADTSLAAGIYTGMDDGTTSLFGAAGAADPLNPLGGG